MVAHAWFKPNERATADLIGTMGNAIGAAAGLLICSSLVTGADDVAFMVFY